MLNVGRAQGPVRGGAPGLVLGRGRGALLHPVGGLAGDRPARGGDRRDPDRPRPWRGEADRGRGQPGRARGGDLRPDRGGRGRAGRGARHSRGTPADGLVPVGRRHADAAGDRAPSASAIRTSRWRWPRASPRRSPRGCAPASSTRAAVRVSRDPASATGRGCAPSCCSRIRCWSRCPPSTRWPASAR